MSRLLPDGRAPGTRCGRRRSARYLPAGPHRRRSMNVHGEHRLRRRPGWRRRPVPGPCPERLGRDEHEQATAARRRRRGRTSGDAAIADGSPRAAVGSPPRTSTRCAARPLCSPGFLHGTAALPASDPTAPTGRCGPSPWSGSVRPWSGAESSQDLLRGGFRGPVDVDDDDRLAGRVGLICLQSAILHRAHASEWQKTTTAAARTATFTSSSHRTDTGMSRRSNQTSVSRRSRCSSASACAESRRE